MAEATLEPRGTSTPPRSSVRPRVVIIGSGFGGSVVALRLSLSQRFEVTLLERGHRYEPGDYPKLRVPDTLTSNPEWAYSGRLPDATRYLWRVDRGLWDLRNLGGLQTLQAAGFGGGSLVYAGVHYRAPDVVFRGWPRHECQHANCTACQRRNIDGQLLADYYTIVERALGVGFSEERYPKTVAFEAAAAELGRTAQRVPLAIHFGGTPPAGKPADSRPCTGCGQCITGCNDGGKNTLDRTYLALAERAGLCVRTLSEVTSVQALPVAELEGARSPRYRVHFRNHFIGARTEQLDADYVFVCAGAVSSTELLLHSMECGHLASGGGLSQLGKRFWANGDAFAVAFDTKEAWCPERGPTITRSVGHVEPAASETKPGATLSEVAESAPDVDWFLLQNGGLTPNLLPALSLLTSPALLSRNAYSGDPQSNEPTRWDWLTRAALQNPSPNVAGLLLALPPDLRRLFPEGTYRASILSFLEAQLCLVQRELGTAPSFAGRWIRRWLLRVFGTDTQFIEELRSALSKHQHLGRLFDAPHTVALAAGALEQYLLGPRPNPHTAIFLAMGADAEWELVYQPFAHHRLRATAKDTERISRLYRIEERLMRDFARAAGGQLRTNPGFSVGQRPITVHNQGGCAMGNDAEESVVDPTGEVWGHPGLFVMDGAALPSSVGVNPSHTIAALAELNVAHFLERTRNTAPESEQRPPAPFAYPFSRGRSTPSEEYTRSVSVVQTGPAPFSPDAVSKPIVEYVPVQTRPTALTWRERMVGFVDRTQAERRPRSSYRLGQLEPEVYQNHYNRGVLGGYAFDLRLEAKVPDLDSFLEQSEPRIEISGTARLRIPTATPHIRTYATQGTLTLRFDVHQRPPSAPPSTRPSGGFVVATTPTMHYELDLEPNPSARESELEHGMAPRQLFGTKLLIDDPGIDAWQDLTTLYTDLTDEHGEVCASGIVRVGLQEFLNRQLPSFTVHPDARSALSDVQKAVALVRFMKRFFGDLARLYDVGGLV